jgi:hypothetical protein
VFVFSESESLRLHGFNIVARNGNLNLMKYMKKHYNYKWSKITCLKAIEGGHLEALRAILKWLKEDGCPSSEETCRTAVLGGHFELLKWGRGNELTWDQWTFAPKNSNVR